MMVAGGSGAGATAYRYYRFWITANNGDPGYTAILEAELMASPGGADITSPGMTATASSNYQEHLPSKAFDNIQGPSPGTLPWANADGFTFPHWLKIDLGVAQVVRALRLWNQYGDGDRAPKDFLLQGSNNDADWTTIASFTGISGYADGVAKELSF